MKIVQLNEAEWVAKIPERWKAQYFLQNLEWKKHIVGGSPEAIYNRLLAEDPLTKDQATAIIGNSSWIEPACNYDDHIIKSLADCYVFLNSDKEIIFLVCKDHLHDLLLDLCEVLGRELL
jgi:hypothetical protein